MFCKFSQFSLALFLFFGIFLKCLSPFLHAHLGASNDSGFHLAGLSTISNVQAVDDQNQSSDTESYAVTVSDARKHVIDLSAAFVLSVFLLLVVKYRKFLWHKFIPRLLFFVTSYLNPKFPPPVLAPPLP